MGESSIHRFAPLAGAFVAAMLLAGAARGQFLPNADETKMSASGTHTCAIAPGGRVKCWGSNQAKKLGNNSAGNTNRPVNVLAANGVDLLTGATALSVSFTSCAIINGGVKCWGPASLVGAVLGGPTTFTPVDVTGLGAGSNVVSLGISGGTTCAVSGTSGTDAQMKCWGTGPVGDGSTGSQQLPVVVPHPSPDAVLGNWRQVAPGGGGNSMCVRDAFSLPFGRIYCWGAGSNGRLGRNDTATSSTPVPALAALSRAVVGGGPYNCLLETDSGARCWGANSFGELGTGDNVEHWAPVRVFAPRCTPDLDGNGQPDALTDGLLGLRVLFGLTDTAVTAGAVAPDATRATWTSIRDYLRAECDLRVAD